MSLLKRTEMFFEKIKEFVSGEISIETKKRRLLRAACITWIVISFVLSTRSVLSGTYDTLQLSINGLTFMVILSILIVDFKGYINLARYLVTFALSISILTNSFILMPGKNVETFLIILGPFSVFFIDRSWVQMLIFSVAFGSFLVLPELLEIDSVVHNIFSFKIIFVFFFFFMKDVNGVNKKSEDSLQKQKQKAEKDKELIGLQKQRLDELNDFKNRFFINIAHELRTPLTLINGYAHQLDVQGKSSITSGILNQSDKMKNIVNDILDLSKLHTNSIEMIKRPIALSSVLESIHQSFKHSFFSKGLNFNLIQDHENIEVTVDVVYFERALNNILLNALKFTETGEVTISAKLNDGLLDLRIEDTGIGIHQNQVEKVFAEFYQVDNDINRSGGSGIGLSFTKSIVELHGGGIEVKSKLGVGTAFTINLPAKSIQLESVQSINSFTETNVLPESKVVKESVTILVVEDHSEMRSYISSLLVGYKVLEAENGLEAMKVLKDNKVDFIVTDYMMPKMDGYEFIQNLKQTNIFVPVIMLTARADAEAKLKTLRLGIDDYLVKPFNPDELLVRIENALFNNKERLAYLSDTTTEVNENLESSVGKVEEDSFVNELSGFIESNCANPDFNLDLIKEEFALSTSSLYRKVKSKTGLSPIELVKEIRLQKVRKILEQDEKVSIKSLALQVGMNNTTYFKKLYFERFGKDIG